MIGGIVEDMSIDSPEHPHSGRPISLVITLNLVLTRSLHSDHASNYQIIGVAVGRGVGSDCVCSRGCEMMTAPIRIEECVKEDASEDFAVKMVKEQGAQVPVPFLDVLQRHWQPGVLIGHADEDEPPAGYTLKNPSQNAEGFVTLDGDVKPGDYIRLGKLSPAACKVDVNGRLQALGHAKKVTKNPAAGAFLFSCAGRGAPFYGEENVDSAAFAKVT